MNIEKLAKKELENWIVTALEGGSNYWYWLPDRDVNVLKQQSSEGDPLSVRVTQALFYREENNISTGIAIKEDDEDGDILGRISVKSSIEAIKSLAFTHPKLYARMITGQYDANDADVWFQLAVMGELRYG